MGVERSDRGVLVGECGVSCRLHERVCYPQGTNLQVISQLSLGMWDAPSVSLSNGGWAAMHPHSGERSSCLCKCRSASAAHL